MSAITDFLKSGTDFLKAVAGASDNVAVWNAQDLPCVFNEKSDADELGFGGLSASGTKCAILIKSSDFSDSSRPGRGDRVTLRGKTWKVESSRDGDVTVTLNLIDASAREAG